MTYHSKLLKKKALQIMRIVVILQILTAFSLICLSGSANSQHVFLEIETDFNSYNSEFNEFYSLVQTQSKEKLAQFENLYSDISNAQDDLNEWWNGSNGLLSLSDKSRLNPIEGVNAHDYFYAIRIFEAKTENIKQKISDLKVIFSARELVESNQCIPGRLDKILKPVLVELNSKHEKAKQLSFAVFMPNHEIKKVQGISLDNFDDIQVSADQIKELKNKENRLRGIRAQETQIITNYNRYIYSQMQTYIHAFGKSQRYRSENTASLKQAKKNLIEAFWTRSFLRKSFGMKLKSFRIEYQKTWFHLDVIPAWLQGKPLIGFGGLIDKDHELTLSEDRGYAALSSLSGTEMNVLKEEIPNRNPLAQMASTITGKGQELNTTAQVVALILADIREEHQLSRQGGLRELAQSYSKRYYDADEAYFRNLQSSYLGEDNEDDIFSDVDTIEDSLKGHFQLVVSTLEAREQRIDEANRIKEYVTSLTKNSKSKAKRTKRQNW